MEVFGTISTALDLIQRIKDSFTKINRALRGGLTISEKIADSLHGIEDLLRQDALMDSPALRGDLIDFEQGLRRILLRRETLLKKSGDGLLNRSIKRLKEVFHPDDVTNDLYLLCERIRYCLQSLQVSFRPYPDLSFPDLSHSDETDETKRRRGEEM
ncbi:hypothetical protein FRC02_012334 [Tulasnella sp. 418]|nr:hypothetical protein FRC02_012334 [Tulasnella sp. 418]